jgi:uncharacterized protein Veg
MEGGYLINMNSVNKIRKDLKECIGKTVILKANKGRKRTTIREGILESAYPSLFVVKISNEYESTRRVSYTYSDVLTSTVEVTVCNEGKNQTKIS